jgi:hypothetical protein
MKIDLYTRCWNDAHMLGFFFRHYDPLVQRYIVYDDGSTDDSLEALGANPKVEVRPMPECSDPDSYVASDQALLERIWKESRGIADWVIVTDIDEHLYRSHFKDYLATCKSRGVTIIPALGYQMLSEQFPQKGCLLSETVTMGAPDPQYSKMNIFSPSEIEAANFAVGRHTAAPKGNVVAPQRDELLLLHYKYLGFECTQRRYKEYQARRRSTDLAMRWGEQYGWSREELQQAWDDCAAKLLDISKPDLRPWATHPGPRWWDGYRRAKRVRRAPWHGVIGGKLWSRLRRRSAQV